MTISAGFRERGAKGAELEREIASELQSGEMALIGPNCLGVMNPLNGLNATFAETIALPGNVAFLSQSGALCTAILDWSLQERVGFSAFVSTGLMVDVGWGDLIRYFGNDPNTRIILLYIESINDGQDFVDAAKHVAPKKPIIALRAGRTEGASKAAASHTGALTANASRSRTRPNRISSNTAAGVSTIRFSTRATFFMRSTRHSGASIWLNNSTLPESTTTASSTPKVTFRYSGLPFNSF